ncbi:unnamed protein product [Brassica rapa subsp. trilocularis]
MLIPTRARGGEPATGQPTQNRQLSDESFRNRLTDLSVYAIGPQQRHGPRKAVPPRRRRRRGDEEGGNPLPSN